MGKEKQNTSWQDSLKALLETSPEFKSEDIHDETAEAPASGNKPGAGRLDIVFERKGRAGKTATIIAGFSDNFPDSEIEKLAASLKKALGCGGSCRGGEILLQGDRRDTALRHLSKLGFKARII